MTVVSGAAKSASDTTVAKQSTLPDSLTVSLVTCYPGPDIYALCGHEGIRIRTATTDSIWNYGLFDFTTPNFVTRFALGETDYMVAGFPFDWFLPEYVGRGSKVVEQQLNLSQKEAKAIRAALREVSLPQNNTYRYNYVKRNCATEIRDLVEKETAHRIIFTDSVNHDTFRDAMRYYHRNYPWYQFGIDLVLGSGLDRKISSEEEMFAPLDMMKKFATAHYDNGKPVVSRTITIYEGRDAVLPATPWYLTPLFLSSIVFIFSLSAMFFALKTGKYPRWWYSLWFLALGLTGMIVAFLVFFSAHEATSPNMLLLWLNPLQLIPAIAVWTRRRTISTVFSWLNVVITGSLLIIWPFLKQTTALAVFPLMGATVATAIGLIIRNGRMKDMVDSQTISFVTPRRRNTSGRSNTKTRRSSAGKQLSKKIIRNLK